MKQKQLEQFLALSLGITERAVRIMKEKNNDRYRRELVGALVLCGGNGSFNEIIDRLVSGDHPLILNKKEAASQSSMATLVSNFSDYRRPQPTPAELMMATNFLIDYYGSHSDEYGNTFSIEFTPDDDRVYLTVQVVDHLYHPLEDAPSTIIEFFEADGSKRSLSSFISTIDDTFPDMKKASVQLYKLEVTKRATYKTDEQIEEESKNSKDTEIRTLSHTESLCGDIRVRKEELHYNTTILFPEIQYKDVIVDMRDRETTAAMKDIVLNLSHVLSLAGVNSEDRASFEGILNIIGDHPFASQDRGNSALTIQDQYLSYIVPEFLDRMEPGLAVPVIVDDVEIPLPTVGADVSLGSLYMKIPETFENTKTYSSPLIKFYKKSLSVDDLD